jgi:hypothetical protein
MQKPEQTQTFGIFCTLKKPDKQGEMLITEFREPTCLYHYYCPCACPCSCQASMSCTNWPWCAHGYAIQELGTCWTFSKEPGGLGRQAGATQAWRRYAGMRLGAEWQAGRRAVGGRQASIRLVCRQTEDGWPCAQNMSAVRWKAWRQGRQAGGREADWITGGLKAGTQTEVRQVPGGRQWKNKLCLYKNLEHLQESGIPTNLNILFHFSIVTICHKMRFWVWDVPFWDELLRMISHETQWSLKYTRSRTTYIL